MFFAGTKYSSQKTCWKRNYWWRYSTEEIKITLIKAALFDIGRNLLRKSWSLLLCWQIVYIELSFWNSKSISLYPTQFYLLHQLLPRPETLKSTLGLTGKRRREQYTYVWIPKQSVHLTGEEQLHVSATNTAQNCLKKMNFWIIVNHWRSS